MFYIVYIQVDQEIAMEWEEWMRATHLPDVLATGCFQSATLLKNESAHSDRADYRVLYRAEDALALAEYEKYKPDLQRDHSERYQGRFEARREILHMIEDLDVENLA